MNKRIKLLILITISLLSMLFIAEPVFAWSPKNQTPIYPQTDGTYTYFCKSKGRPLRFTQVKDGEVYNTNYKKVVKTVKHVSDSMLNKEGYDAVGNYLKTVLADKLTQLDAFAQPIPSNTTQLKDYSGGLSSSTGVNTDLLLGPYVCITPEFSVSNSSTVTNNTVAYILSAGSANSPLNKGFEKGNYTGSVSDTANDSTIQQALWNDSNYNEGNILDGSPLYAEAKDYENFYQNEINSQGEYKVSVDSKDAKVIVNQEAKTYTIGPYKITYPDDSRFSYIEKMTVKTDTNEQGIEPTQIIFDSRTENKKYPSSGEYFFVEFSAETAKYPKQAMLDVSFAYLSNTSATYDRLTATGRICQFIGSTKAEWVDSEKIEYIVTKIVKDENGNPIKVVVTDEEGKPVKNSYTVNYYDVKGIIEIKETARTYNAQPAARRRSASRTWTRVPLETPEEPLPTIDLTMKLGGKVFEDSNSGKISDVNGLYEQNKDKPMPNVVVTLYKQDGTYMGSTVTDANGNYEFAGLDTMFKYYVKFTYNGQYYEPTKYSGTDTWGTDEWDTNSNGTDRTSERKTLNMRFQTIESSPQNYKSTTGQYNETYSKKELLGYTLNESGEYEKTKTAVIDEFGNLILQSSNDAELNKKIQFVKDCLMNSYTSSQKDVSDPNNQNNTMDLYPTQNRFVISDSAILNRSLLGNQNITLLYDDIKHINQGLSKRHEVDLALIKDVEKVTLEINGQTHTYNYDNLDKSRCTTHNWEGKNEDIKVVYSYSLGRNVRLCPNCGENIDVNRLEEEDVCTIEQLWDIDMRLSDAQYYNTDYTRELYKSDYLYNVGNVYGNYSDYGKTKDDELKVFITYKLMIYNHSMSINTKVEEIVDYYDEDLRYVPERSYITIGSNKEHLPVDENYNANTEASASKYAEATTRVNGYRNLYIQGLDDRYLLSEETAYVYLTFEVEKESNGLIKLDQDIYVENGQIVYKDRQRGKENIAEINGYTTKYADGVQILNIGDASNIEYIAGIIDRDSKPGNIKAENITNKNYEKFEDDTDEAPNISIKLYQDDEENARVISGVVWEDERTKTNEALKTTTGDGKRSNEETLINGVTVQLVELMDNGTEYVWREFGDNAGNGGGINTIGKGTGSGTRETETPIINASIGGINLVTDYNFGENKEGAYAFKSFAPGKYVIRFIYGDTTRTVTPASFDLGGLNQKSYNGQDYKSTAYQSDVTTNAEPYNWYRVTGIDKANVTGTKTIVTVPTYDKNQCNQNATVVRNGTTNGYLHDIKTLEQYANVSDAKDIASNRENVNSYSANNVTHYMAEILASHKEDYNTMNDRNQLLEELTKNTKMTAETGLMVIEFEKTEISSDGNKKDNTYHIANIDLGLEERPKAQLAVDKQVTNVKLTLADGSILFDAKDTATNVLWRDHKKYDTGYTNKYIMDPEKFGNIENIRNENASKFGLIQLSMDEELMHGATMEVTYEVNVTNVGEVDYKDNKFYYTGDGVLDNNSIVTTSANQVIDYVANNLQFNKSKNANWNTIKVENMIDEQNARTSLINANLKTELEKYNTIITTESLNKALKPAILGNSESTISTPLVLTQLITTENDTDDLTYENIVEIVKTSNTVGRRMEYSVVGNQNPSEAPQELDSDKAEVVKVLPPFGNAGIYIMIAIITIAAVGVIITGIIFIKKKVLTK